MDNFTGTAALVLHFLKSYKLKRERFGQYRSNSPLRPDSNSMSFVLKIEDSEKGAFIDHVSGESGSLYDLALRLGVIFNKKPVFSPTTPKTHKISILEDKKGLTLDEFSDYKQIPTSFLTSLGIKQIIGKYGLPEIRIPYFNANGALHRERIRYALKAKNGSAWSEGNNLIPYGLDRLNSKNWAIFAEGESDPITAWLHNLPALGIPGASSCGCLQAEHIQLLKSIYYWREPDKGGDTFAKKLVERLSELGFLGEIFELKIEGVKDLSDLYLQNKENFPSALSEALEKAIPITLPTPTSRVEIQENDDFDTEEITIWPSPLGKAAMNGIVGSIVSAIEPHTEADPAAMLMQFLTCFGSIIGRKPHFVLDGSKHFTNIFLIVVGASATGRKGTSLQHVKNLLNTIDSEWSRNCIAEGLSSGEGLIYTVRDPIYTVNKEGIEILSDVGCKDKRLLVIESEFMNTLGVMMRQGNTLSAMIRRAWNGEILATLTKNSPLKAIEAYIAIIGHITKNEYLRGISKTETSNGFANRFIHCVSRRSKSLPIGGKLHSVDFAPIVSHLTKALEFAKSTQQMYMDENSIELWRDNYENLVGEHKRSGLLAEVTARATGHVVRMAMIYSLLDFSKIIRPVHLEAALECWRYAEDSAKYVFGNTAPDPISDKILTTLKSAENGLTQNQLRNLFSRNASSSQIKVALSTLLESNQIEFHKERLDNNSKKPTTFWSALKKH